MFVEICLRYIDISIFALGHFILPHPVCNDERTTSLATSRLLNEPEKFASHLIVSRKDDGSLVPRPYDERYVRDIIMLTRVSTVICYLPVSRGPLLMPYVLAGSQLSYGPLVHTQAHQHADADVRFVARTAIFSVGWSFRAKCYVRPSDLWLAFCYKLIRNFHFLEISKILWYFWYFRYFDIFRKYHDIFQPEISKHQTSQKNANDSVHRPISTRCGVPAHCDNLTTKVAQLADFPEVIIAKKWMVAVVEFARIWFSRVAGLTIRRTIGGCMGGSSWGQQVTQRLSKNFCPFLSAVANKCRKKLRVNWASYPKLRTAYSKNIAMHVEAA